MAMIEHDLTTIISTVSEDFWNARVLLDGRPLWADAPFEERMAVMDAALPFVFRTVRATMEETRNKLKSTLEMADEAKYTDAEKFIILRDYLDLDHG